MLTFHPVLTIALRTLSFVVVIQALGDPLLESPRRLHRSDEHYPEGRQAAPQLVIAPKVNQRLRDVAEMEPIVPVFVVLADQPLREVYRQIEAANSFRLENAEAAYGALAAARSPDLDRLARARDNRNGVILAVRQAVAREMEAHVRPQQDEIEAHLRSLGATRIGRFTLLNMMRADIPSSALSSLEADPRIIEVALIEKSESHLDVSVPALGAPAFWSAGFTGTGESVAVLDSGVYAGHPAFGGRIRVANFVTDPNCSPTERNSADDFNGHGTHVAGIIASQGTAAFPQLLGVARGLVAVYSAKIGCEAGTTSDARLAAAEAALATTPIAIINNSSGRVQPALLDDDFDSRKIDELVDTYNLTWVNSAGNSGQLGVTTPGTAFNVISVGNIDTRGTVARADDVIHSSSSRGPTVGGRCKPDIVAPGTSIRSTDNLTSGFVLKTGTSMAAPHIAGAAALLRQSGVGGRLNIKALLLNTTDTFGWRPDRGWGHANLARALAQARNNVNGALDNEAGSFRLFRGIASATDDFSATLVWNRFVRGTATFLRAVDLFLYKQETSAAMDESRLQLQNVEQVGATPGAGNVVLKVKASDTGRGFTEPFAMAISSSGFAPANGPIFDVGCSGPSPVAPNATFNANCTISNKGDLEAFLASGSLSVVGSSATPVSQTLGTIAPHANVVRTFTVTAPGSGSSFQLRMTVASISYGEVFGDAKLLTVPLSGGGSRPSINANGVENGGSSSQPGFTAAQWVVIKGTNLANVTRILEFVNGSYPASSDGVSVTMNGRPAPLWYISPTQLNVISPDLTGSGPVQVVVTNNGVASDPVTAQLRQFAPAFFPWPGNYAVATDQSFQFRVKRGTFPGVNTTPVKPGDVVILWGTGFGPTSPAVAAGQAAPSDRLCSVANAVRVTIGGLQAEFFGAALAPGFASLYQIAVRVPNLSDGDYPVVAEVGGFASPTTTLLTVQR